LNSSCKNDENRDTHGKGKMQVILRMRSKALLVTNWLARASLLGTEYDVITIAQASRSPKQWVLDVLKEQIKS